MTVHFRNIAVTVVKTHETYRWRLMECEGEDDSAWTELSISEIAFSKYHQAMAAGLLELQQMIDALEIGPTWTEVDCKPVGRRSGAFGFGGV